MSTPDGITNEDWDYVHELAVDIVNTTNPDQDVKLRERLFEYLSTLDAKYGPQPSLLATRADYIIDNNELKADLLRRAYALAESRGDQMNALYSAHSLAELFIEDESNLYEGRQWLARVQRHLDSAREDLVVDDFERLTHELMRLSRRTAG